MQSKFDTVMIIDDSETDLYISSRLIIKNNFGEKILEFLSGQDALLYLQQNQDNSSLLPQIIFIDIYMPLMSGFEFLEEYEKLSTTLKHHCRVFMISSTIDELDIVRARKDHNIALFQVKPITKEFLERIMVA